MRTEAGIVMLRLRRLVGRDPPVKSGVGAQVRLLLKCDGVLAQPRDLLLQTGIRVWVLRQRGWNG